MKKYHFSAVVFNSNVERHEMPDGTGRVRDVSFVVDLATVRFPRNPCVVDYDHDTKEPIGAATLAIEDGQIVAQGKFVSAIDGDRAFSIGTTFTDVPYGISPTLDLDGATVETVPEGAQGSANGQTYPGPVFIYRDAAVLGISVCPLPTDCKTSVSPLGASNVVKLSRIGARVIMSDVLNTDVKPIPVDEETVERLGDETGTQEGAGAVRDPELQAFIDEFGLESGVVFFQRGLSLDEARMEDYRELKRLSKVPLADGGGGCGSCDDSKKEENETTEALLARLHADVKETLANFKGIVAMLRYDAPRGAVDPPRASVWAAVSPKKSFTDAIIEAARKL